MEPSVLTFALMNGPKRLLRLLSSDLKAEVVFIT